MDVVQLKKWIVAVFVIGVGIILALNQFENKPSHVKATWLWSTELMMEDDTIDLLKEQEVTHVYLQIDEDIEHRDYADFIHRMNNEGIKVLALEGKPTFDENDFMKLWNWLKEYEAAFPKQRFEGIHLDVEPYLSDLWDEDEEKAVEKYQHTLQFAKDVMDKSRYRLEVDIPFWYDKVDVHISYDEANLAEWVFKNMDGVTMMAYRNSFDSIKRITAVEMEYANKFKTPFVIGLETKPAKEDNISFADVGIDELEYTIARLEDHYEKDEYYIGIAIHHMKTWKALIEND